MKRKTGRIPSLMLLLLTIGVFSPFFCLQAQAQTDTATTSDMSWWENARFGMFIHWGLYAEAAGEWDGQPVKGIGEWIMNSAHIPHSQYEQLAAKFDPVDFNASQWVKIAKEAGIKYIVITSKHHDGFCMFNTKATNYNIVDATPWHKDPLALLSKACNEQGIKFCTYYSVMDWHTPFQQPADSNAVNPTYNPTTLTEPHQYISYMKQQLHELISQYHTNLVWFDGGWLKGWTADNAHEIYNYIHSINPSVIINNRLEFNVGDYGTPEQEIPVRGLPGPWETCMTLNDTWGFKKDDDNWKSDTILITNLIHCASGGGNFLLNVGPSGKGIIPQPEVDRLRAMGRWLKVNGDAIYGSQRTPFKTALPFGYATEKPGKIFLEVTQWPQDGMITVPLKNKVIRAYLLAQPNVPLVTASGKGLVIHLPKHGPDPIASVVVLQIYGQVETD
ncbi:MAG: alpha-L-fucosidase [Ginsengibacter sp.]